MSDLRTTLERRSTRGTHIGSDQLRQRVTVELVGSPQPVRGWAIAFAVAATVLVVVGGSAVLFGGSDGSIPPADSVSTTVAPTQPTTIDLPTTVVLPTPAETTTTFAPETTATSLLLPTSFASVVAELEWKMWNLSDALDSGIMGFDRAAFESDLILSERLQRRQPWPYDRFPEPDFDCMGGWNGEQVLDSPGKTVAICDIGDWTPLVVRTFVFEDDTWIEYHTTPQLRSGWVNTTNNPDGTGRDGSIVGDGNFGAAIDIGMGFMANGTDEFVWASSDGLNWTPIPDTRDAFPDRSVTRAIGTSNGLVYILGELNWPAPDPYSNREYVVWIAELPTDIN